MIGELILCVLCSVVTSIVVTKALATHYFDIVDGYVRDMVQKTKAFMDDLGRRRG